VIPGSARFRLLLPILCALLCALTACATEPLTPLQIAGLEAKTIVVAPFNLALPLPERLEASTAMVEEALVDHLRSNDKQPLLIDDRVGKAAWREAILEISESGGQQNFETAIRVFNRKIHKKTPFDAIIVPSLYIQNAASNTEAARWDGTGQKIEFRGRARKEIEMPPPTTIPAASILIYVFDSAGNQIHTKRTGLELIQHMEIHIKSQQGYDKRTWTLTDDTPAIESEVRVGAAVAHSLYPFLPK
jgi:hypothetical protein